MDWDKLKIFKAVAEAGSFTHAEENLNLSQSAISRQIATLESELGLPLFHRHARGLVLTEQGEMLLQTACEVTDRLSQVEMQLKDTRSLAAGPLNLTTVEFIASSWLAPRIPEFKELFPQIQLTMLLDDRVYDLNKREADVAIRLQRIDNSDLIERHMATIRFSLCASKSYLDEHGRPNSIADFKKHLMIGHPINTPTPFLKPNWLFNMLDIDIDNNPNVTLTNSMQSRRVAVGSGAGITSLPDYIIAQDASLEVVYPELNLPGVDMFFVYPQERRNSQRIIALRDFLIDHINRDKKMQKPKDA